MAGPGRIVAVDFSPARTVPRILFLPGTDGDNARYRLMVAIRIAPLKVPRLERK